MGNKKSTTKGSNGAALNEEMVLAIVKQTRYSRERVLELHQKFLKICPNGEFERKNFVEYFSSLRPDKDSERFCDQLFNAFDFDKNGSVDFVEFLIALSLTQNPDPKQQLSFIFKMYDLDGNNQLDLNEIEKIILGIYDFNGQKERGGSNSPREVAKHLLRKHDKDENGFLTEDEFIHGISDPSLLALNSFSVLRDGNIR